ncbi:MAG TPA: alpha/beta hydrolase [Solirubrobacteraceae bacterium]|nr:alpha/beta hydrolase [Solirubrobacteraceae bacterium]
MSSVRHTRLDVEGIQTRVLLAGPESSSEAVLFVHGNPGSADDWEPLTESAGGLVRAVAFDLPDFGDTQAPAGFRHTTDSYAAFVQQLVTRLGIERVHLVLHDFGGPIGLAWLASNPDALASITLIDTGILPDYHWHFLARVWRAPILGEVFQATATRPAFRWLVNRGEPRGLPREFLDGMYDHYDRRTRRAVLELYRDADDPAAGSAELAALMAPRDVPALVVWGEHDAYLPYSYAARQREAFPSADVHVLPASGHWPYVDAADTVQRLLLDFLRRVLGREQVPSASPSA